MPRIRRTPMSFLKTVGEDSPKVTVTDTAPTTAWVNHDIGDIVVDKTNLFAYMLISKPSGVANWDKINLATGIIDTTELADDAVTTAKLDPSTIQYTTASLTNANIKALRATPIELVAAPGAGNVVEFISAQMKLVAGTEVLSESADNVAVKYTDGSGVAVSDTVETTGFIDQAVDTYSNAVAVKDAIVAATGAENQALVLHNTGAAEIAGNASADATMEIGISYRIHAL